MRVPVSMTRYQDIEMQLIDLDIEGEENEEFSFEGDVVEDINKYELCLVGRYLIEKNINVRTIKTKMTDVWKPVMGINIKGLETSIYPFQFYHKEDIRWVLNGGSWSFDNVMLIIDIIPQGEEPLKVSLRHLNIWIQIHDLPTGFMSEIMGKQLGDFFSEFLLYDHKNNTNIWRECMRIQIH